MDSQTESPAPHGKALRYVVALVLACGIAVVYTLSLFGAITVCHQQLAQVGANPLATVCGTLQLPDLIPAGAIVILLLAFDFDVSAFGFSLKSHREIVDISQTHGLTAARHGVPAIRTTAATAAATPAVARAAVVVEAIPVIAPGLEETLAAAQKDNDANAPIFVLEAMRHSEVYVLGLRPADAQSDPMGGGNDLLHFTIKDKANVQRVMLPIFTNGQAIREALRRNPEWNTFTLLKVNGEELWEQVDSDVILVINPWVNMEFQLPKSPSAIASGAKKVRRWFA